MSWWDVVTLVPGGYPGWQWDVVTLVPEGYPGSFPVWWGKEKCPESHKLRSQHCSLLVLGTFWPFLGGIYALFKVPWHCQGRAGSSQLKGDSCPELCQSHSDSVGSVKLLSSSSAPNSLPGATGEGCSCLWEPWRFLSGCCEHGWGLSHLCAWAWEGSCNKNQKMLMPGSFSNLYFDFLNSFKLGCRETKLIVDQIRSWKMLFPLEVKKQKIIPAL